MRVWVVLLPLTLLAGQGWLSKEQSQKLDLQKQQAIVEAKKLRDSWINPIQMQYRYQKGNQFPNQKLETFTITVDQPIFKSGGIWAAILYADATKAAQVMQVESQRRSLVYRAMALATRYKILQLQIKKQKLALQNALIDIEVKRENFLHGQLDGTFLDDALMKKNSAKLRLIELQDQKEEVAADFAKISDADITTIDLPHFKLIEQQRFLESNYDLAIAKAKIDASRYNRWMQIARYLPSVSLFGSYNYQQMRGSLYFPGYRYSDTFYTYGIAVSMPLFDINSFKNVEQSRLEYLQNRLSYTIERRDKELEYKKSIQKLHYLARRIALAEEDIAIYEDLIERSEDLVRAGEKTSYDLRTLQNSLKMRRLDIAIYRLQRQEILQNLYKELHP